MGMSISDPVGVLPDVAHAAVGSTYAHRFVDATRRFAQRPALRWKESGKWREMSYSELEERVFACAAALLDHGITTGDRVAIWLDNSWPWIVCDLATQLLGAVTTPIYHTLSPAQAVSLLRDAQAKAVLSDQFRLAPLAQLADFEEEQWLVLSCDHGSRGRPFAEVLREGAQRLEVQHEMVGRFRPPPLQPEDLSAIFYTSGTTGEPKGAMLTHGNVVFNAERTIAQLLPQGEPVTLLHLPLAHVIGRNTTVPATLLSGGVLAIAEPQRDRIPSNLLEVAPTAFPTVPHLLDKFMQRAIEAVDAKGPVMRNLARWALRHCRARRLTAIAAGGKVKTARLGPLARLLDHLVLKKIRAKLGGRMQFLVTGGATSHRQSMEFFWGLGIPVFEGYGATELTGTAAITWPGAMRLGTVGQAVPGVELKLAADGEILVRGPIVMKGYWQQPEATRQAIDREGWYHTGDIGSLDGDGYLSVIDRKSEIFVLTTGKNVPPQVVESTLSRTPLVSHVCAIGHDQRFVTALIVPNLAAVGQHLGLSESLDREDPRVAQLLRNELVRLMSTLSDFERVKRFSLVAEPFTPESGLTTGTLKLLRREIAVRFAAEIEDLYVDCPQRAIAI
jgi:long-chain acyl-CoA synthetase